MEMRDRILDGAEELYFRYGVRSVTMDDIANHLSISKKTIYQHFNDKDDLVINVMQKHLKNEEITCNELMGGSGNAILHIYNITKYMRNHVANINPSLLFDLKKYHSKAFKSYESFKHDYLTKQIEKNLSQGIEEGFYRKEINIKVITKMRLALMEMGFDATVFPPSEFNIVEVQLELFEHFLRGVLTPQGLELLEKYRHENENN